MTIHVFYILLGFTLLAANNSAGEPTFYTQSGFDPAGEEISTAEMIPIWQNARFARSDAVVRPSHRKMD